MADSRFLENGGDKEAAAKHRPRDDSSSSGPGVGEVLERASTEVPQNDALYNANAEIEYKNMEWWHVGLLMIAETISLGILSLPFSVAQLGFVPGVLFILFLGLLATYSGFVIGQFKLRHPTVHSMADAGFIIFGRFGWHLFNWAAVLSLIFIMAAHILTFSVAMNVLTGHGACTILWAVIGFIISVLLTLPRTLKNVSYFSILSFVSIIAAVMTVIISIGITPPTPDHELPSDVFAFAPNYTLTPTFLAILNICIAFMGNVAFFGFIAELREPRDFPKSLVLLQTVSITFYIVVGCVIYHYVGTARAVSPALGAASPIIQKAAYGIAMPTIIVAGVINAHVAIKTVYVQVWSVVFKQPAVITQRNAKAIGSWVAIVVVEWIIALVLALAIPVFEQMLGLISALFGSWFTYGVSGMFWVSMNQETVFGSLAHRTKKKQIVGRDQEKEQAVVDDAEGSEDAVAASDFAPSEAAVDRQTADTGNVAVRFYKRMGWRKLVLLALNVMMICVASVLCGLGLYASAKSIADSKVGKPFSCDSNVPDSVSGAKSGG